MGRSSGSGWAQSSGGAGTRADRGDRARWGRGWRGRPLVAGLLFALSVAVLGACGERERATEPERTVVLVASIYPLSDLAQQVAGQGFEVHTLLAPGATPHGAELTSDKLRLVGRADVMLTVGVALDPWAAHAAQQMNADMPVLEMAEMLEREAIEAVPGEMIQLDDHDHAHSHDHDHDHHHHHHDHHHAHTGPDAHLWLDPVLVKQWVRALSAELTERFPERAEQVERNTAAVIASLEELDRDFRQQLADVPKRELVTFHNAFDRLARRYGLVVVAHLTEVELDHGVEIRPGRWRQAVAAVREFDLRVLYAEPQFPARGLESLQREAGVELLRLDPVGHPQREGYRTYQEMMRSNLATLVEGQSLP